jgi:hypothetical protein
MIKVHFMVPWSDMLRFTEWLDQRSDWLFTHVTKADDPVAALSGSTHFLGLLKSWSGVHDETRMRANIYISFLNPRDVMYAKLAWEVFHTGDCPNDCSGPQP